MSRSESHVLPNIDLPVVKNSMVFCHTHGLSLAALLVGSLRILGQETGCNASVTEGGTAKLTFLFRNELNTSSDNLYAYLRRSKDPESDILRCFQLDAATGVECTATTPQYKAGALVNHRLNMFIPNVTRDFEDTYVLRAYVNDSPESPISCSLRVKAKKSEERGQDSLLWIVLPVGIAVLIIIVAAVVIVIICWRHRRKRPETSVDMTLLSNVSTQNIRQEDTSSPLLDKTPTAERQNESLNVGNCGTMLPTITVSSPENKHTAQITDLVKSQITRMSSSEDTGRVDAYTGEKPNTSNQDDLKHQAWYFGGTTNEQAQLLLASDKNGHGSFLVIDSGITNEYRLKAKFHGQLKSYSIRPSSKGFFIEQGIVFDSVTQLIDNYKKHSTRSLPAVLSTPCVR
ncbi:uncharacterized protein [Littorina saxatilis]|uniref:uncharacterized protein isoform X1 n=1 Tax=Littorina saxatilis TaxID=31220 RepID=UPI0038B612CA